jgi:signal transduction histidine kinase/CheY-like chemotaxis protein
VRTVVTNGKLRDRSGREEHLVSNAVARVVEDGTRLGAVLVFRDITERSRLEQQAAISDRLGSLATMAATVAHEINNPLTFNLGNVEFALEELRSMRRETEDGKAAARLQKAIEALEDAKGGAERIAHIVTDLRSLSRTASQPRDAVDVSSCVRDAIKLVSKQVALTATLVEELGETPSVSGNEVRLSQVVVNLLVNAAQAMAGRPADNEIRVVTTTGGDGSAVIEVSDTGPGIPQDIIDRIFDPFFTTKQAETGTGLGLAISRGIVNSLGGRLTVHSIVGEGTTFRIVLPAHQPLVQKESEPGEPASATRRRACILLVDDEPLLRKAIHWMLSSEHDVTMADGAAAARELMKAQRFDLVLCDLIMPRVGGIDLYQELLASDPAHAERMVFMTGGAFQSRVAKFVAEMGERCIQKPFGREHLVAFMEQMLDARTKD